MTLLTDAKELISDERDWVKGTPLAIREDGTEAHCAIGACNYVALKSDTYSFGDLRDAYNYLKASLPEDLERQHVATYNDRPETTHDDIMALFDRAIEKDNT